jgi:hypothetical protein
MTTSKSLEQCVQDYTAFEDATADYRVKAERDRDYYDGNQWTAAEIATLNKRKQPVITINRIAPKINFIVGTEVKTRTDPKAQPRTPRSQGEDEVATDVLRYIADRAEFPGVKSDVFKNVLIEGYGGCHMTVEAKGESVEIKALQIPWDRIVYDPHSRKRDFSDASYLGEVLWMDYDDALARWPDKEDVLDEALLDAQGSETFDDKPNRTTWADGKRKRIKAVLQYYRCIEAENGSPRVTWYVCEYTRSGFLSEPKPSPYVDEHGNTMCPIILASAFVDRDGMRYGIVRNLIPIQDEINKRRSKALHLISMRQTMASRTAVDDVRAMKAELSKPDGHVELNGVPGQDFQVLPTGDMAMSQFQLLAESKQEIDTVGPNASMTGTNQQALSGRAIMAQQQAGYAELGGIFDGMSHWARRAYVMMWDFAVQFWIGEMWIRVVDDPQNLRFVPVNRPVTKRLILEEHAKASGQQVPPEALQDPSLDEVVNVQNDLAGMDVDIIIDESPDVVTLQQEQFETLAELAKSGMPIPPDAIIEASSIRNKKRILEKMKGGGTPEEQQQQAAEQQQQQAMAQQMAGLQMQRAQAETRQKMADAGQKEAQAVKIATETQLQRMAVQRGLPIQ